MKYHVLFYLIFIIFLATFRYPDLAALYALVSFILFLAYLPTQIDRHFKIKVGLLLLIVLFNLVLIPIMGVYWRAIAFLIYFVFLVLAFDNIKVDATKYLRFVNITYVVYVILSYLVYFSYIKAGLRSADVILNQFEELYFESNLRTMIGFEGSTAGIDAYSMLVLIMNVLFHRSRLEALFMIALSLTNVIWSTRLTPWAMVIVPLVYFAIPSSIHKAKQLVFVFLMFVSFSIPAMLTKFLHIDKLIWTAITHGRSGIWDEYTDMLTHSSLSNILFGFRDHDLPYVSLLGGTILENQPHSSYLRILLNYGIAIYLFFIYSFYRRFKNVEDKKATFVLLAIMIAATTNINVFYNDNPVYLLTFFVFSQVVFDAKPMVQKTNN